MTPEQRLNRVERILGLFVREERRWRVRSRKQDEKINILIQTKTETSAQINKLTANQMRTDQALRAFIKSLGKNRNGLT